MTNTDTVDEVSHRDSMCRARACRLGTRADHGEHARKRRRAVPIRERLLAAWASMCR
jgi:hypothetical protein